LRQLVLGYLLGTGAEADALSAAMAPVELWWSVLGLAVIFGFVPKLSESGALGGYSYRDLLKPVARLAIGSAVVFLVFARPIVMLVAPGMTPETASLAAGLLRVIGLAPAAVGCSFVYSALLLSRRRFVVPSVHHAVVNVSTICGAFLLHAQMRAYGFAVGYTVGACVQLAISHFYSMRLLAKHPEKGLREDRRLDLWGVLSGPGPILGQALCVELGTAVSRAYASTFGVGMTAAFEYGFKLFRVPMAMLVVPLSQSLLPEISSLQADPAQRRQAVKAMQRAAALIASISGVAMVVMLILRERIVALLFERGQFGEASTAAVAVVLLSYMPVILGRSVMELLSRTLFGLGVYRIPIIAAALALGLNAAICALLPNTNPAFIGLGAIVGSLAGGWVTVAHVWRMNHDG
jgi:putative peptidoglycan lipid II flippase